MVKTPVIKKTDIDGCCYAILPVVTSHLPIKRCYNLQHSENNMTSKLATLFYNPLSFVGATSISQCDQFLAVVSSTYILYQYWHRSLDVLTALHTGYWYVMFFAEFNGTDRVFCCFVIITNVLFCYIFMFSTYDVIYTQTF